MQFYPPYLHDKPRGILREYLQVKILNSVFSHPSAKKLCFIWWTALRLVYGSARFSEDIDFDNRHLTPHEFEELSEYIAQSLRREGYEIEIKNIIKGAFHCEIKIPGILYHNSLASMITEKLVIKIDTASQGFDYVPEIVPFQMFEYSFFLKVVSKPILLSMKLLAYFWRIKGRDIFDIVYLLGMWVRPDLHLLRKISISSPKELKDQILQRAEQLDFNKLNEDLQPFLFQPSEAVKFFPERIKQIEFA